MHPLGPDAGGPPDARATEDAAVVGHDASSARDSAAPPDAATTTDAAPPPPGDSCPSQRPPGADACCGDVPCVGKKCEQRCDECASCVGAVCCVPDGDGHPVACAPDVDACKGPGKHGP